MSPCCSFFGVSACEKERRTSGSLLRESGVGSHVTCQEHFLHIHLVAYWALMHSLVSLLLLLLLWMWLMLASLMCCQLLVVGKFLGAHTTFDCTLPFMACYVSFQ